MLKKNFCPNCGEKVKNEFLYCPKCGTALTANIPSAQSNGIFNFNDIEKEFEKIDKMLGEFFKTSKIKIKSLGSISIVIQGMDGQPMINIKNLEPRLQVRSDGHLDTKTINAKTINKKNIRIPKKVMEPKMSVQKSEKGNTIFIELPGVKSTKDIELKRLENSIEIKAFSGNTAYFKLIPTPSNASVKSMFKNNVLKLDING